MRFCLYAGIGLGAIMALLALGDAVHLWLIPPVKSTYHLMGHNFDAFWQIQLPTFILGLVMVAGGLHLLSHVRR